MSELVKTIPVSSLPQKGAETSPAGKSWLGRHKVSILTGLGVGGIVLLVSAIAAFTIFAFPVVAAALGTTAFLASIPLTAKITTLVGLTIATALITVSLIAYRIIVSSVKQSVSMRFPNLHPYSFEVLCRRNSVDLLDDDSGDYIFDPKAIPWASDSSSDSDSSVSSKLPRNKSYRRPSIPEVSVDDGFVTHPPIDIKTP